MKGKALTISIKKVGCVGTWTLLFLLLRGWYDMKLVADNNT